MILRAPGELVPITLAGEGTLPDSDRAVFWLRVLDHGEWSKFVVLTAKHRKDELQDGEYVAQALGLVLERVDGVWVERGGDRLRFELVKTSAGSLDSDSASILLPVAAELLYHVERLGVVTEGEAKNS